MGSSMITSKLRCVIPSFFVLLVGAGGCSSSTDSEDTSVLPLASDTKVVYPKRVSETPLPVPNTPGAQPDGGTVPDPNAPYFATVTANGTGCPAGTWDVD